MLNSVSFISLEVSFIIALRSDCFAHLRQGTACKARAARQRRWLLTGRPAPPPRAQGARVKHVLSGWPRRQRRSQPGAAHRTRARPLVQPQPAACARRGCRVRP